MDHNPAKRARTDSNPPVAFRNGRTSVVLSNDSSAGPRRSRWGVGGDKNTMPTGMVTVNVKVYKGLAKQRASSSNLDDSMRMGSANTSANIDIMADELFIIPTRSTAKYGSYGTTSSPATAGFTKFNGMSVMGIATDEELNASFRVLGRAKGPFKFNSPNQGDHGTSVQVRGSMTIANNSIDARFFPGDIVGYEFPSITPRVLRQQLKSMHRPRGGNPEAVVPIIKRITYREMYKGSSSALKDYYAHYSENRKDALALKNLKNQGALLTSGLRYALTDFKKGGLSELISGLSVLLEYGIIDFTPAMNALTDWKSPGTFTALDRDIIKGRHLRDIRARQGMTVSGVSNKAREQANKLIVLAGSLDLLQGTNAREAIVASHTLINELVMTQQQGLIDWDSVLFDQYSIEHFLKNASNRGSLVANRRSKEAPAQLALMQSNGSRGRVNGYAYMVDKTQGNALGKSMNSSRPGESIDLVA